MQMRIVFPILILFIAVVSILTFSGILQVTLEKQVFADPIPSAEKVLRALLDYEAAEAFCEKKQEEADEICGRDTSVGAWRACVAAMEDAEEACEAVSYWRDVFLWYYIQRYYHPHSHSNDDLDDA